MSSFFGNMFGGSDVASQMQKLSNNINTQQNAGMRGIDQAFAGFTPAYYNQAQQGFMRSQLPQLQQQGLNAQHQLGFGMANRGLWNSSSMDAGHQGLSQGLNQQRQGLAGNSVDFRNSLQGANAQQQAQLMQQLYQSMAPQRQQMQVLQQAGAMGSPSPLGPIMQGVQGLGTIGLMAALA